MIMFRSAAVVSVLVSLLVSAAEARADGERPPPLPPPTAALPPAALPTIPSSPSVPMAASPSPTAEPASREPPSASSSSLRLTYEASRVDRPAVEPLVPRSPDDSTILHGFRLGYGYVANYDQPAVAFNGKSLKEQAGLRSPHHFLLGYEVVYRVVGHSWLNVLLLGNAMVAGLEQSKFLPSANALIGFELKNTFQVGVGANLTPLKGSEAHTIIAAGWTPRVGTIYTPIHFFFIPDVDGVHRMGITTGVTF